MRVGLDRSRFPGSHVTPGAPARKEVFETALEGPARTQSDVFLVFSRTGNPLVKTVFLRGQRKLTKNSSTDFTLLATIVTIVAEQLNFDAQEAQYTTKTTTPVATEGDEEKKQTSEFSLVYFLALFLSRFKCASSCQRSLRQRRDALKSLPKVACSSSPGIFTSRDPAGPHAGMQGWSLPGIQLGAREGSLLLSKTNARDEQGCKGQPTSASQVGYRRPQGVEACEEIPYSSTAPRSWQLSPRLTHGMRVLVFFRRTISAQAYVNRRNHILF